MQRFNSLLLAFQTLPKEKQNRTVMQVSGYPHYENVCSNILAFYLDPAEEHNMGGLVLESLLEVAQSKSESPKDNENTHSLENVSIYREYGTSKRQRIDLVVTGEEFVIGIENKIYHWVANDLDHYSDTIEGIAKAENASPELHPYKIVLGLTHPPHTQLSGGFVSITYEELWQQVQLQLGAVLTNASPKWVTYLLDFIQTTEHLKGNHMEFKENDQFFIDHHAELHKLFTERHQFFNRLGHQAYRLFTLMNEDKEALAPLAKGRAIFFL
ncbi:MAG: PD-(D/E)XK nuclease family protein [Akkermansiaceae bacterium]